VNVTVVCDVLGEENNGTTIAAMNLIRSLRAKGHTVRALCTGTKHAGEEGFYIVPSINFGPFNGYVAKNGVALARPVRRIMEEAIEGADVVHIMIPFMLGVSAARIAWARGIPVTAGFHCQAENLSNHLFLMNSRHFNRWLYKMFYQTLYGRCDCVHYPTRFICDTFEAVAGPTNHYIISNGVNASFVKKDVPKPAAFQDKFVILFTGRYSREKSHKVLLDAAALSRHKEEIQLIFAGTGPQRKNLEAHARRLGIAMPVMQFYSRRDLVDVINYADLYVHPAEIEIEAIACLEAIACGKVPVIADSPRSATRYFALTPENLFRVNDPKSLAQRIDYWIEHPAARAACSEQYLGYAETFAFDQCMDRLEGMLADATKKEA